MTHVNLRSIAFFFYVLGISLLFSQPVGAAPQLNSPALGEMLDQDEVTLTWTDSESVSIGWWVYVGSAAGSNSHHESGLLEQVTRSYQVSNLPENGSTLFIRLWYKTAGGIWEYLDSNVEANDTLSTPEIELLPVDGQILNSTEQNFSWSASNSDIRYWWLFIGSSPGANNLADSGRLLEGSFAFTATDLPDDGSLVSVRLWYQSRFSDVWQYVDQTYQAHTQVIQPPLLTVPAEGVTLESNNFSVAWQNTGNEVDSWWLYLGSGPGKKDLYDSGMLSGSTLETSVENIPLDGENVHFRLWHRKNEGPWAYVDTTRGSVEITTSAELLPLAAGSMLSPTQKFEWSVSGNAPNRWWLYIGNEIGSNDHYESGPLPGSTTSIDVEVLPNSNTQVYVRLWFESASSGWQFVDETYLAPMRTVPDLDQYDLVFSDEFNQQSGAGLDPTKWDTGLLWGPYLPINNEEQMYIDSLGMHAVFDHNPFELTGTTLKITATPTSSALQPPPRPPENDPSWQPRSYSEYNYNGPDGDGSGYEPDDVKYLSGIVTSYGSFRMTHGYVEARVKLPQGKGLWPAFWLLPAHYIEDVPEIDVMEFLGHTVDRVYHTYHYFDPSNDWQKISTPSYTTMAEDWTQDFHVYGMAWSPREIVWYVDGVETRCITDSDFKISGQAMYLLENLAVGGNWPGSPDETTVFPASYEIDYIRAYKRELNTDLDLAADYQLMFSDEFEGNALDSNKWNTSFLWGPYLTINNEEQYYVDALGSDVVTEINSPFSLNDGVLSITARSADDPDSFTIPQALPGPNEAIWSDYPTYQQDQSYFPGNYTSGLITSYDSFKFAHGYAEIRARLPAGAGLWPAFWLLNGYYVSQQPEIDIMEMRGENPHQIIHSYHRQKNGSLASISHTTDNGNPVTGFTDDFHVFGVRWTAGRIDWYIDGEVVYTYEDADVAYQLMYVLANLAVGGNFNFSDVDESKLPARLDIDYIRVYQERYTAQGDG